MLVRGAWLMALFLRPLRLASAAYRHLQDWAIVEDGRTVGRIIEDGSASTPPDRRWSWSIVVHVHPMSGIVTSGRAASLRQAKADFHAIGTRLPRIRAPPARDFQVPNHTGAARARARMVTAMPTISAALRGIR